MADTVAADTNGETRHPFRGLLGGLLFGLGLALLMLSYSFVPLGTATPWIVLGAFTVLGVVWGLFGPRRGRRAHSLP